MAGVQQPARVSPFFAVHSCRYDTASLLQLIPCRPESFAVHSHSSDTASELQSLPCRPESFAVHSCRSDTACELQSLPCRPESFAVHSCRSDTASELQSLTCRPESFPVAAAEMRGVSQAAKRAGGRERYVQAFAVRRRGVSQMSNNATDKAFPCAPTSASIASVSARELPCGCIRGARRVRGRQARVRPREARASIRFSHLLLHVYRDTPRPPVGSAPKSTIESASHCTHTPLPSRRLMRIPAKSNVQI